MKVRIQVFAPAVVGFLLLGALAPTCLRAQQSVTFAGAGCGTAWMNASIGCSLGNSGCAINVVYWDINFLRASLGGGYLAGVVLGLGAPSSPILFPVQLQPNLCLLHETPYFFFWNSSTTGANGGLLNLGFSSVPRTVFPIRVQGVFWEFSAPTHSGYVSLTPAWELMPY